MNLPWTEICALWICIRRKFLWKFLFAYLYFYELISRFSRIRQLMFYSCWVCRRGARFEGSTCWTRSEVSIWTRFFYEKCEKNERRKLFSASYKSEHIQRVRWGKLVPLLKTMSVKTVFRRVLVTLDLVVDLSLCSFFVENFSTFYLVMISISVDI